MSDDFDFDEFAKAMKYCGIPIYEVEDLMNENGETKVEVLSKSTYIVKDKPYDCVLCHKPIAKGFHYVRIVVKPVGGKMQTQRWCLPCWLGLGPCQQEIL